MAYSWGFENFDWSEAMSGQDIPEEIEKLVINAVEELFQNVPADSNVNRALKVREAIRVISDTYKTKLSQDIRPNWEDPAFRCAYVYLYFLKHSSLVCDILHTLLHPRAFESAKPFMRVCCAGGGPGSDVVGTMMYLLHMNYAPFMECTVMDINPSWKHAWETIQKHIPPEPKVKVNYIPFDMADETTWLWRDTEAAVANADLVTFVKSLSAVQTFIANHRIGTGAIPAVLRAMKPGAMVLYIDNMRDDSNMMFLHMTRDEGRIFVGFVKSLSAVQTFIANHRIGTGAIPAVLRDMKPGAMVVYIDNMRDDSNMMFLHMTRDEGIHLIEEWHDESYSKPSASFLESMKHFEDMFEYRPLRGCKVSAFLFRKAKRQPEPSMQHWAANDNDFVIQPSAHNGGFTWSSPYSNHQNNNRHGYGANQNNNHHDFGYNQNHHDYGYHGTDHNNMGAPFQKPPPHQPMLQWTPFGGEVREYRLDPLHRPTFIHLAMVTPPNETIMKRSQNRRRRRSSPMHSKYRSSGNRGVSPVNMKKQTEDIDFTAD